MFALTRLRFPGGKNGLSINMKGTSVFTQPSVFVRRLHMTTAAEKYSINALALLCVLYRDEIILTYEICSNNPTDGT